MAAEERADAAAGKTSDYPPPGLYRARGVGSVEARCPAPAHGRTAALTAISGRSAPAQANAAIRAAVSQGKTGGNGLS